MASQTVIAEAQKRQILCVPVQGVAAIANDNHLRERGFFQRVQFEQLDEELELFRAPFVSSSYRAEARPAPALGQHTAEVLLEWCGLDVRSETEAVRA
jgi:crotonobetainyl-CoA:carnitine CoA-transferase CaiB-like acyl-CoA transferase